MFVLVMSTKNNGADSISFVSVISSTTSDWNVEANTVPLIVPRIDELLQKANQISDKYHALIEAHSSRYANYHLEIQKQMMKVMKVQQEQQQMITTALSKIAMSSSSRNESSADACNSISAVGASQLLALVLSLNKSDESDSSDSDSDNSDAQRSKRRKKRKRKQRDGKLLGSKLGKKIKAG